MLLFHIWLQLRLNHHHSCKKQQLLTRSIQHPQSLLAEEADSLVLSPVALASPVVAVDAEPSAELDVGCVWVQMRCPWPSVVDDVLEL